MDLTSADRTLIQIINTAYPLCPNESLPTEINWETVSQRAQLHGLAPLLFDGLKKIGILAQVPPEIVQDLRIEYLRTAHRNHQHDQELQSLLDGLAEANIPVILVKGCLHNRTLYEKPAQRPMADLDMVVPESGIPYFMQLLTDRGYTASKMLGGGFEEDFGGELCLTRDFGSGFSINVEPHWHLFNSHYYNQKCPIEWIWQHTELYEIEGRQVMILTPTAELLHLCAHLYIHHGGTGLRQSLDIARLLTKNSSQIDWEETNLTAHRMGIHSALVASLHDAEDRWHVTIPVSELTTAIQPSLDSNFGLASTKNRYSRHLLDFIGAGSSNNRWDYLRKLLFPSQAYMRYRYGMTNPRLAPFYYMYRLWLCLVGIPGMLLAIQRRRAEMQQEH